MKAATSKRILRQPDVIALTCLSKSTLYKLIYRRKLKAPIKIGTRAVGWFESDIDEIMAERIKAIRPYSEQGAQR